MLFQSQEFLLGLLPCVLAVWYGLARAGSVVGREWALIALSLVFYGWWDVRFVPLLLAQTILSWVVAVIFIATGRRARWLIWLAIAANLAILGFFKYWTFFAESVLVGVGIEVPPVTILLPIGISFFTFEIISYLADVSWHQAPRYPLRRFIVFVSLFPRLIAGPIVRHHEIIPQLDLDPLRTGVGERLAKGATLLTIGLAKKVFLADSLAPIADRAFTQASSGIPDVATAWSGALAFSFQLFLDFSAYSEMAIGIALMLGLTLPENFRAPYAAVDLRDFWRRWHMTLSRYLRDYVYIPLGGSKHGVGSYLAATMLTMGLCGLWHGAGWTFIAWGFMHGVGLVVCRAWGQYGVRLPFLLSWAITMAFVVIGWVLFRAPDFSTAASMLAGMAGAGGGAGQLEGLGLLALAAALSTFGPTSYDVVSQRLRPNPILAVVTALVAIAVVLEVGKGQPQTFIYFQF
ncbi:Membrane bound O-acyl transferase MBOAT family protein [Candidatus Filomicrobium marinum]|uniref:Probable alginate O-acetylase AlgI n=1 Tax=Candidatus Filomicrobium marinum TaxID=1608628 RepID=A0A0D6JDQ0_9HYPH|nr:MULTISPECIES: MBOAT family O-acyltransferase [Filomicrobium]MCV0368291.1 MBOAT family protein [Filomicrobium sp.]CFX12869.1 Membrane bound O-acyl transferase MBOAT family protein [Candidatus Filomicrobium marinum]CPR17511.1 Membrane bound O-acyl transferase MBOAT family protein [Candidatus Filomicrobium marinum]